MKGGSDSSGRRVRADGRPCETTTAAQRRARATKTDAEARAMVQTRAEETRQKTQRLRALRLGRERAVVGPEARENLEAEINRIVKNAARAGAIVRPGYFAGMLASAYSEAGFSADRIAEAIADAARTRGIPVEIAAVEVREQS